MARTCELSPFLLEALVFGYLEEQPLVSMARKAPARAPHPGKGLQPLQRIASKLFASCGAGRFFK